MLRVSLVGISYCSAVTYPAGLLLLGCTGEKRGKLLQLTKMVCPNYDSYIEEQWSTSVLTMGKHAFVKCALLEIQDKQSNSATPGMSMMNFFFFFSLMQIYIFIFF